MNNCVEWENQSVLSEAVKTEGAKNCPNCGAPIESEKCPYCGTVFIDFACVDADEPFYMKIKSQGKIFLAKVVMTDASFNTDYSELYGDGSLIQRAIRSQNLSVNFAIVR